MPIQTVLIHLLIFIATALLIYIAVKFHTKVDKKDKQKTNTNKNFRGFVKFLIEEDNNGNVILGKIKNKDDSTADIYICVKNNEKTADFLKDWYALHLVDSTSHFSADTYRNLVKQTAKKYIR